MPFQSRYLNIISVVVKKSLKINTLLIISCEIIHFVDFLTNGTFCVIICNLYNMEGNCEV